MRTPHKRKGVSSNLTSGIDMGGYTVGVAGQTVNLLSSDSGGSTPSPPTKIRITLVQQDFDTSIASL